MAMGLPPIQGHLPRPLFWLFGFQTTLLELTGRQEVWPAWAFWRPGHILGHSPTACLADTGIEAVTVQKRKKSPKNIALAKHS